MSEPWDGSKLVRTCPGTVVLGVILAISLAAIVLGTSVVSVPGSLHTKYVSLAGATLPDEVPSGAGVILFGAVAVLAILASFITLTGRRWAYYLLFLICASGTVKGILTIIHSRNLTGERPVFDLAFLPFFFLIIAFGKFLAFAEFKRYRRRLRRGQVETQE